MEYSTNNEHCNTEIFINGSAIPLISSSPIRRRETQANNKACAEQEKEWTTARCHRLLRALTSRVAILKKELLVISGTSKTLPSTSDTDKKIKPRAKTSYPNDDTDWNQGKKKVRRTYSGRLGPKSGIKEAPKTPRARGGTKRKCVPGEILVPTPILTRARGTNPADTQELLSADSKGRESKNAARVSSSRGDKDLLVDESIKDLRKAHGFHRIGTYDGIYNGLETLLTSTNQGRPRMRKGAGSLMSMCLKLVPRYIEQEQATALAYEEETGTKSAINPRDVSMEIYDDLEQFGSVGHGWRPLRVIVRAHGIKVLQDAIAGGLLDILFCGVLVNLCIQNAAHEEAASLITPLLSLSRFAAPKSLYDPLPTALTILWNFANDTANFSFLYEQLANMLLQDLLPLGWLATREFRVIWSGVMQRLPPSGDDSGVLSFLEAVVPALAGIAYSSNRLAGNFAAAVDSTYSSLLTTLLSVTILSSEKVSPLDSADQDIQSDGYKHIGSLLENSIMRYDFLYQGGDKLLLLLATTFFAKTQERHGMDLDHSSEALKFRLQDCLAACGDEDAILDDLAVFICSVANCCGRAASGRGFEYLKLLHASLEECSGNSCSAHAFQEIIVKSAFTFANDTPEREQLKYASALEAKYFNKVDSDRLHSAVKKPKAVRSGFRWEDGIGEWVTGTPVIRRNGSQTINTEPMSPLPATRLSHSPLPQSCLGGGNQNPTAATEGWLKSSLLAKKGQAVSRIVQMSESSRSTASEANEVNDSTDMLPSDREDLAAEDPEDSFCSSVPSLIWDASETPPVRKSRTRKRKCRNDDNGEEHSIFCMASPFTSVPLSQKLVASMKADPQASKATRAQRTLSNASQTCQIVDDSEDELSLLSESRSQHVSSSRSVLFTGVSRCQVKRRRTSKRQIQSLSKDDGWSEDELCI
ncbi:hypothetical protein GLAREA_05432 [Glarea lozoyensis ATCC 20868]|uniref:Uncharacterized protein n=1 Tax=Glarea lozoyensis (strain ATCC 20868 / MF5171) TaxID=1116229 RepID=S3DG34_GLAL2|nr:uncharacterized protein GLAREA_05432 [Glarea lozoyensis ATCC 20868]EPE36094.1 hypothetical protein GLAREA_05432 [Glarea lozoyensis ATCC 20868]